MDSAYVVKVQYKSAIRRLILARGQLEFSYEQLQSRIRDLFQLPTSAEFGLTYIDRDGDVVTMAEDEDLKDALVLQALNPLRVTIENLQGSIDVTTSSPILPKEASSDEVTGNQTVEGESIPSTLSESLPVDPVADADPVINSDEPIAEPTSNSGENSEMLEGNVSKDDGAPESKASDGTSPASGTEGSQDAKKDVFPEGETTKNPEEAEGAEERRQIHFGIQCDGCRMVPISGPRFKSCRTPNYDLCLKCFEASGAEENEYAKIDRLFYRIGYPAYLGRICRRPDQRMCRKPDQRPTPASAQKDSTTTTATADVGNKTTAENSSANSDPRVLHVGVQCDECGMVPLEGPRFKSVTRFNYDLCRSCFEKSGSNASEYSRIDQPVLRRGYPLVMGQLLRRAGPRIRPNPLNDRWVWVLSQIVPISAGDQAEAEEKSPVATGSDVKVGGNPPQAESAATSTATAAAGTVDVATTSLGSKEEDSTEEQAVGVKEESNVVQIPVIITKEEESGTSSVPETQGPKDVSKESMGNNTVNNLGETAGVEETVPPPPAPAAEGDLSTQEGLLAKLAAMGFEDPVLNGELLKKNNFDLRKTLDDLCAAEEWDPILGELQEMGFYDANMNRRLMFKNNGSVKRVVKELVQMYKGAKTE